MFLLKQAGPVHLLLQLVVTAADGTTTKTVQWTVAEGPYRGLFLQSADGSGIPRHALTAINARRALGAALTANGKWTDALDMFDTMQRNAEQEPELARKLADADVDTAHAVI